MPINERPLPERVEKTRKQDRHFDLENADLTAYFKKIKHKKSEAPKKEKSKKKNKKQKDLALENMPEKTETVEEIKKDKKIINK